MIYPDKTAWDDAAHRRIALFGMSGLGKTVISDMLRQEGDWFHYSVDYRIGTRYMGEHIVDNFKREAMKVPFLRDLLRSDSIYIGSNITFRNLDPLSTYLGKPGNPAKGGIPFAEYERRQAQHRAAEQAALLDTAPFVDRAQDIYGYDHFVCDTGGSICEVVDADDPDDPILTTLTDRMLLIWLKGSEAHTEELIDRFDREPKPMYYPPEELRANWADYRAETGEAEDEVDPDRFVRWSYRRLLETRQARYAAMARWGITLDMEDVTHVRSAQDILDVIGSAITRP
ncbi:MAG: ATPase [Pseudomonadota bacterium]